MIPENLPNAVHVTVCASCPAGEAGFAEEITAALRSAGLSARVAEVECMSGCTRPSTIAFRATGKTAYLFGDVGSPDIADILTFVSMYAASPDGNFSDARPLGGLRLKALARIPG